MQLLLATTNRDKLREITGLLAGAPIEVVGLRHFPAVAEPEETGLTFEANARLKALYYDRVLPRVAGYTVSEDSGLVIDALGGEPGVHSARFLRPDATYAERFAEIYRRLASPPTSRPWSARFVCAVAVVREGTVVYETTGTVEGEIAPAPRGEAGFGYDPIFHYPAYGCTLAEVAEDAKLRVAHRGQAFRALARWLGRLNEEEGM